MKTKRGVIAVATILFAVAPFCSPVAGKATVKSHRVTLKNLTVDSVVDEAAAKTITAHSDLVPSYTINLGKKANVRRGTGDKAKLSEVSEGDSITVWGKTVDGTTISATKVKDNSIRKIRGLYRGTMLDFVPVDISLPFGANGACIVYINSQKISIAFTFGNTKFKFGKHKITYADLQEGDVISIKGILHLVTSAMPYEYIYNTSQINVRSHGAVPTDFLIPTMLKK